jgi:hypothetical protein
MKNLIFVSFLLLSSCFLGACASEEPMNPADPMGDIGDSFMTQQPRTVRRKTNEINDFFFKHCDQDFNDSHYSKTSYFCNDH